MIRNREGQFVTLLVINASTNSPAAGETDNLSASIEIEDGDVESLGEAEEIDPVTHPGLYRFPITKEQTNHIKLIASGVCTTENVYVVPREYDPRAVDNHVSLTLGATIPMPAGQVTGLDEELVVGDSYTEDVGRRIPVILVDSSGNQVSTTFGLRSLADADCSIIAVLHPENARNIDNVVAAAQGECEFVSEVPPTPALLWLSLTQAETARLSPGVYRVQFRATWGDGETVTLAWKGSVKFTRRIKAKR